MWGCDQLMAERKKTQNESPMFNLGVRSGSKNMLSQSDHGLTKNRVTKMTAFGGGGLQS